MLACFCVRRCEQVVLQVCCGNTGHAEAVQLVYDDRVKFDDLVRGSPRALALRACKPHATNSQQAPQQVDFFYSIHNASLPRSKASQYRSAIFYDDEDQKAIAEVHTFPFLHTLSVSSLPFVEQ